MPRIPVRTEPYASPSRQHRHFKNKRDQVLRALGKAAYINGSHFAIMWVTASGQAETYASDAFQGRLDDWFDRGGIKDEGIRLVLERSGKAGKGKSAFAHMKDDEDDAETGRDSDEGEGDDDDDGTMTASGSRTTGTASKNHTPLIACEDVFGPVPSASASSSRSPDFSSSSSSTAFLPPQVGGLAASRNGRKALAPLDTNSANQQFTKQLLAVPGNGLDDENYLRAPMSAPLPNSDAQKSLTRPPMLCRTSSHAGAGGTKLMQVTLPDAAARTAFFELRFGQMQQGMCKTVAKAWIKIIEPKKQTRCPYNKGEEGKPDWWPEGVRHKEPDHLMKPERHSLLLTILRSPKIKVARLQLATAEVVAMIRADKVNLLMDVYRIAREEERLRQARAETADSEPISVGVSTLDGWKAGGVNGERGGLDEEGKRATLGEDTPESEEKSAKGRAERASKKRSFAQALSRSMSTSAADKRPRASADAGSSNAVSRDSIDTASLHVGSNPAKRLSAPGVVGLQRSVSHQHLGMAENELQRSLSGREQMPSPASVAMTNSWSAQAATSAKNTSSEGALRRQAASSAAASAAVAAATLSYGASGHRGGSAGGFEHLSASAPSPFGEAGSPQYLRQQGAAPPQRVQSRVPAGAMSAPQGPHAALYPAAATSHHGQPQGSASATASPALNYNYQFNAQFMSNPFDQPTMALPPQPSSQGPHGGPVHAQQQQHGLFTMSQADFSDAGAGALGLHGLPTDLSSWSSFDPTFVQWPPSASHPSLTQHQQQSHLPFNSAPARIVALPSTLGDDSTVNSSVDLSTGDLSFASSAGPATPPQGGPDTHALLLQRQLQSQAQSQPQQHQHQHQHQHQQKPIQQQQQQQQQQAQEHNFLSQMYPGGPRGQAGSFDAWVTGS
ncbi:unnamed protein product [Parajaminaea phylloscopi]